MNLYTLIFETYTKDNEIVAENFKVVASDFDHAYKYALEHLERKLSCEICIELLTIHRTEDCCAIVKQEDLVCEHINVLHESINVIEGQMQDKDD